MELYYIGKVSKIKYQTGYSGGMQGRGSFQKKREKIAHGLVTPSPRTFTFGREYEKSL